MDVVRTLISIPCLLIFIHSGSQNKTGGIDDLAAKGQIQEAAPVKAASEIIIHAPLEKVWRLLTDINHWPQWQSNVSAARIDGPLQPGTNFAWTTGGAQIRSRIALAQPFTQLAWTGTVYRAKAIHVWRLQSLPDGTTLVKTNESMDGFMLKVFYSSNELSKSQKVWLDALKRKAEQQ